MITSVGSSVRDSQDYVRKAGAAAREMLIAAAAQGWKVPAQECRAENSRIIHARSQRTVSFGNIAAVAAKLDPPEDVKLKDPKDWKIAGKPAKRLDISNKVQGQPIYGIDVRVCRIIS